MPPDQNSTHHLPRKLLLKAFAAVVAPFLVASAASDFRPPLAAHLAQSFTAERQSAALIQPLKPIPIKPIRVWSGLVSWYGPKLQGQPTASGESFDMFAATAAHPWLPFGSLLRLINLRNGRSQIVRINDRGPFTNDRELDVSYFVASKLGLLSRGVDRVRIELLEEPRRP